MSKETKYDAIAEFHPSQITEDLEHGVLFTTLDMSTKEGKAAVYNSISGSTQPVDQNLGREVHLLNFTLQPAIFNNEDAKDGEEATQDGVRVIMQCVEGLYGCASGGMVNALRNICAVYGHPATWDEPIKIAFAEERTRKGRKVYTFNIV